MNNLYKSFFNDHFTRCLIVMMIVFCSSTSFAQLNNALNIKIRGELTAVARGSVGSSYNITVPKPAGATTVNKVFVYYSGLTNSGELGPNAITVNGVSPNLTTYTSQASFANGYCRYAEVSTTATALVNTLNTLAAGSSTSILVNEGGNTPTIEGVGLLILWNVPSKPVTNFFVKLGSALIQSSLTGSFAFNAVNKGVPNFTAVMGVGVAFSIAETGQSSILRVGAATPSSVVSNNVGGYDDGELANGALITLGGVGDSPATNADDELYDMSSFLTNGQTQLSYSFADVDNFADDWLNVVYFTMVDGSPCFSVPVLSANTKSNTCPATTVDLTTITATNNGTAALTWHTDRVATTANKISGTAVSAGNYYAAFYDSVNNCYSPTVLVRATVNSCLDTDGDGFINFVDLDSDNDGILNTAEGMCSTSSNSAIDGFDNPLSGIVTVNGNNIQTANPYNGWTAINPVGGSLSAQNAFNVIRVDGTGYASGPDNAHSGDQYLDMTGIDAVIYKEFIIATPTVVSASAWFANRETASATYTDWSTRIEIINTGTNAVIQGNLLSLTKAIGDKGWYQSSISNIPLLPGTYRVRMYVGNFGHVDSISFCFSTDTDGDTMADYLDVDSDNDLCPDAIEGSENVKYDQVNPLGSATNPGQINVLANGITKGTPSQIVSTLSTALGVPMLVNNAANNNGNVNGVADNTDGSSDVGQGIGNSENSSLNDCKCYLAPATTGTDQPTQHGITAFNRAGGNNSNWPMIRNNGWTALESSTKALVINRMASATSGPNIGEPLNASNNPAILAPIIGMSFYDTTTDCLKINVDGTRAGWKCYNVQTCPTVN